MVSRSDLHMWYFILFKRTPFRPRHKFSVGLMPGLWLSLNQLGQLPGSLADWIRLSSSISLYLAAFTLPSTPLTVVCLWWCAAVHGLRCDGQKAPFWSHQTKEPSFSPSHPFRRTLVEISFVILSHKKCWLVKLFNAESLPSHLPKPFYSFRVSQASWSSPSPVLFLHGHSFVRTSHSFNFLMIDLTEHQQMLSKLDMTFHAHVFVL